ncbi:MAG: SDR family oxidoreductase, partial [Proteobacteria bacterium]|nr:SDR family oxidoreductase [Pseudomonadota bacterium]
MSQSKMNRDEDMALRFRNKVGVVMGVANRYSIATAISHYLSNCGAEIAYSYQPCDSGKMARRVSKALDHLKPKLVVPCDVRSDDAIHSFFDQVKTQYGHIDFLVHSIAYSPMEDLKKKTVEVSRAGFLHTMDTSVYSFLACSHAASLLMNQGGAMITLTYIGGERVVPGYNVMGLAKAALNCAVKYLSHDLSHQGIRANGSCSV